MITVDQVRDDGSVYTYFIAGNMKTAPRDGKIINVMTKNDGRHFCSNDDVEYIKSKGVWRSVQMQVYEEYYDYELAGWVKSFLPDHLIERKKS